MGRITQRIHLTNLVQSAAAKKGWIPKEKVRSLELNSLVDTGAAMLCLPLSVIELLELEKLQTRTAITANGVVERGTFGPVILRCLDREASLEVMELPDDGTPALLGYLPLETLDLYPNPKLQILEGNPAHDGKMIVDLL